MDDRQADIALDARRVETARSGDTSAFSQLFENWFDRCYDVAFNIVRNDDTAAEVAQDTFVAAWQGLDKLDDPTKFGGWILRISRNKALNRLQRERRSRPEAGDVMTDLHDRSGPGQDPVGSQRTTDVEELADRQDQRQIVWAAASVLGPAEASLMDLLLRHQLTPAEIADELGIDPNNAHQRLHRMRAKLGDAVANHQLWRGGRPQCDALRADLAGEGDEFTEAAHKRITRHARRCEHCSEERKRSVSPEKLFAAVPVAVAPGFLRSQAAAAMEAELAKGMGPGTGEPDPDVPGSKNASRAGDAATSGMGGAGGGRDGASGPSDLGSADPSADPSDPRQRNRRRRILVGSGALAVAVGMLLWLSSPAGQHIDATTFGFGSTPETAAGPTSSSDGEFGTGDPTTGSTTGPTSDPSTDPDPGTSPTTTVGTRPTTPTTTGTVSTASTTLSTTVTTSSTTTRPTLGTTQPTLGTTQTTLPPPPPPTIVRFTTGTPTLSLLCIEPGEVPVRFLWLSEDATSATLTLPSGRRSVQPSGDTHACAAPGTTATLAVTGPGGTANATTTT